MRRESDIGGMAKVANLSPMLRFALVTLLSFGAAMPSSADELAVVTGSVERISSEAWIVTGFDSALTLADEGLSGEFRIERIMLTESDQVFDDIRIDCGSIVLASRTTRCSEGSFTFAIPGIGRQTMPGSFTYDRRTGTAEIELARVAVAGGNVRCSVTASEDNVDVRFSGSGLQLSGLLEVAANYTDALSEYFVAGLADVNGTFSAPAGAPMHIALVADLGDTSLANNAGTIAADGVAGKLDMDIALEPDSTRFTLDFSSQQGEAYLEPVYANFSGSAFSLHAEDVQTSDFTVFTVPRFRVQQESLLDLSGSATLHFSTEGSAATSMTADVELVDSSVANLYENLVKIAAAGTMFGDLATDGTVSGSVSIVDNELRATALQLDDTIIDDNGGRFAIYGLGGAIDWAADENFVPGPSRLRWESGTVYNIIIGGGAVNLQLGNNDVELLAPLRLPMLGGALLINRLALNNFGSDDATGVLDAGLEPVQLGQLTAAFGWPAFSGNLSGTLPLLQLAEDTITIGGTLSARAFDGTMEVSNLRVEQPFGLVPRLQAAVTIRDLELQRVTEVFSFGLIQGRLSGEILGLEMQDWRPVAMDMRFYTPPDDRSQHRISQRAVENLANVGGGGAAAVLSTGFLQFFDVFAYDRIGLRCVLADGVCRMSGVGPTGSGPQGTGYYLVKGRGVPRIDVVGFRDTVSWPRLVQQLAAITRSGSPTMN